MRTWNGEIPGPRAFDISWPESVDGRAQYKGAKAGYRAAMNSSVVTALHQQLAKALWHPAGFDAAGAVLAYEVGLRETP